jgi:hypothetical protein
MAHHFKSALLDEDPRRYDQLQLLQDVRVSASVVLCRETHPHFRTRIHSLSLAHTNTPTPTHTHTHMRHQEGK